MKMPVSAITLSGLECNPRGCAKSSGRSRQIPEIGGTVCRPRWRAMLARRSLAARRLAAVRTVARIVILALLLTALLAIAASAAGSGGQAWVTSDCVSAHRKPQQVVLACDGTEVVKQLSWSAWRSTTASATGTDLVDDCRPSCNAGHIHRYAVTLTLSKPKNCAHHRHRVFAHATVKFGRSRPGRLATEQWPMLCPAR